MRAFAIALAALLVMGPALTHAQSHLTNHWAHYSTGTISKVAFSRDGRYRIVGGYGAIRVENAKTGIELRVLPTIADNVTSLAISPDGSTVADCGTIFNGPSVVELWNITSGRCIDCKLPIAAVNAIAYSPTGKTIVIGGAGLLQMWTVSPTFGILRSLVTSASSISSLTYSPSGATIAVGGSANSGGTLEAFDSISAKRLYRLPTVASQSVTSVVYSPDGKFLVDSAVGEYLPYHGIATYTTTLESWNTVTGKLANSSGPWGRSCNTLAFSADGHTIASGFGSPVGAELLTWNFPNLGMGSVLQTAALSVNSVTFAPDGKSLVDGGRGLAGGLVESWSTHTGDLQVANDLPYSGSYPITLSSNGRWLVTVGQTVELLNASNGLHANDIKTAIDDGIQFVVLAADNQVAIGGYSTQYGKGPSTHVELRDIRTGTSRGNIATAANLIYAMVSSKDGRMLAVTGSPSSANMSVVEVWDVATKSKISSIEFPSLWVRSLAFAPDGKSVAIGGNSGPPNRGSEVEIWNLASGTLVSLASNCYQVRSLAFSPDGSRLAVGGSDYNNDGVTEEWNVPNGALVRSLKLGLGSPIVQTLVYSPTRPVLFAATSNGLQVFDSVTGNLIHAYLVGGISDMAIWPDGSRLAISTTNGATMVVDAPNEVR